uniref:DENN domain-containing protein 3-like n=1 Tax=Saccoglossus kowalevskii TaxID=10224 RepID=A0ABM0MF43_SACKO|nr:PREDICTED: DENN domain-containing protein 3-like [Saccoglossus kowalevskii]
MAKLHNSVIEMCVVVGMDENTGLKPANEQPDIVLGGTSVLYRKAFDSHILAALSGKVATFPQAGGVENLEPEFGGYATMGSRTIKTNRTLNRSVSRRMSRRRISLVPQLSMANATTSNNQQSLELPIGNEVLTGLMPLCLPDGGYARQSPGEDKIHTLVLTDIQGTRSYATCLTYYRRFLASESEDDGYFDLLPEAEPSLLIDDVYQRCYLPTCVVLISKCPYYSVMKDCLSSVLPKLKKEVDPVKFNQVIKEFTLQVTMVTMPPAGTLTIVFKLYGMPIHIRPSEDTDKPVCDMYLQYPFLRFSAEHIIELMTCILTQQKIVFLSNDYSLITPVMESFMTYIQPLKWPHTYVPILPYHLLDLVEAPGTFLMGCHSKYIESVDRVEQIPGLVVANIDDGEVLKGDVIIPNMPLNATEFFEQAYIKLKKHFDLAILGQPTPTSLAEMISLKHKFMTTCQQEIQSTCLELMVLLLGDVSNYLHIPQRHFKRKEFLDAQIEEERDFYAQVIKTEMFSRFLRDRLDQKRDYYAIMEEKMRLVLKDTRGIVIEQQWLSRKGSSTASMNRIRRTSDSVYVRQSNNTQVDSSELFILPSFQSPLLSGIFWERCILELNRSLEVVKSPNLRASYLYLRGMFQVACGRPIDGIEDFHNLAAADLRIFPSQIIGHIIDNLSASEKVKLSQQSFYKRAEVWKKISERKNSYSNVRVTMELEKVPTKPVDLSEFVKHIQLMEIAIDIDAITRLFYSLTLGRVMCLDPETFAIFYQCWKEAELETSKLELPHGKLDANECVLKVSSLIRADHGTGRLILTQKRLFFLTEGKRKFEEVIRLRDIKSLEKFEFYNVFPPGVPALKIFHKQDDKAPYIASLKCERNCWWILIREMWAGRLISDVQKDPQVIQQAAQNVLMIDAIIRSGESDDALHSSEVEAAAKNLCYFSRRKDEGVANIPQETTSALIHRVNPSSRDEQKATVEALLYTPGNRSDGEEDNSPKLWCALGSGKIRVFDASTWICESQFIQAKDRVCCLLSVKGHQVWAGSFDTTIYIIDVASNTANKRLIDHTDFVSDLTINDDESVAFSASLNGQIMSWNTDTLQKIKQLTLENVKSLIGIKWIKKQLWCCTKRDLRVIDDDGNILKKLEIHDGSSFPTPIESYIITPDNQIWAGDKCGTIHVFNTRTFSHEKELIAHEAAIRSMCTAEDRYVMTGAEGMDGKIAIWRARFVTT